mmetsp:Transcript_63783/g.201627  ORF Transcript_63783/g.201627 Transcript_63783/m.201627 type:complete len:285 (-) Transcript_63783:199-1053(-)
MQELRSRSPLKASGTGACVLAGRQDRGMALRRWAVLTLLVGWLRCADARCGERGSSEGCSGNGVCSADPNPDFSDPFFDSCVCHACWTGINCETSMCRAFGLPVAIFLLISCCCVALPVFVVWMALRRCRQREAAEVAGRLPAWGRLFHGRPLPQAPLRGPLVTVAASPAMPRFRPQMAAPLPDRGRPAPASVAAAATAPSLSSTGAAFSSPTAAAPPPVAVTPAAAAAPTATACDHQKFNVRVPEGVGPGARLSFRMPSGQEAMITVPEGVEAGGLLEVELPS